MNKPAIYKIVTLHNNKFYIGSAIKPNKRKLEHLNTLKFNKHANNYLQKVYNKYGKENIKFEIVEEINDCNILIEREQYYIDTLNPEYNIQRIAGGSALGCKRSEETKLKISNSRKGQLLSEEHKRKLIINKKNYKGKVYQYDNNTLIKIWDMNVSDIEKQIGCYRGSLTSVLCKNRNTLYGFSWKYEKEVNND